jgi:hypothetical protein
MKNGQAASPDATTKVAHPEVASDLASEDRVKIEFGPEFAIPGDLRRAVAGLQALNPATILLPVNGHK